MKKLVRTTLIMVLCALLTVPILTTAMAAESGNYESGDYEYYLNTDGEASITEYIGSSSTVTIPDTLDGHTVTDISMNAFSGTEPTSISIPGSVTRISDNAFYDCPKLTQFIVDPDNPSFTADSSGALYSKDMKELLKYPSDNPATSYTIPGSVENINYLAFDLCTHLIQFVTEPNDILRAEDGVLFGLDSEKNLHVLIQYPIGNTSTSYTIPAGTGEISECAFKGCTLLTEIDVASGNTAYKSFAGVVFTRSYNWDTDEEEYKGLVQYPAGNTSTSYAIPDGVTYTSEYAFYGSSHLENLSIPASLGMFYNGNQLGRCRFASFSIDPANPHMTVENGVLFDKYKSILIKYPARNTRTSYAVPNGLMEIYSDAFYSSQNLTSITFPQYLAKIREHAFDACTGLTNITLICTENEMFWNAFKDCTSLKEAIYTKWLPGFISANAFAHTASGFRIRYHSGDNGWVTPSMRGIPTAPYFNVIFDDTDSNIITTAIADCNTTISPPAQPTKSGYIFAGWYKDYSRTTSWNFSTDKVNADTIIYAKWTQESVNADISLEVYKDNGTGTMVPALMNPAFNMNTYKYSISLEENESNLSVRVTSHSSAATVKIDNQTATTKVYSPNNGQTSKCTILVTAGKLKKTYTISITRKKSTNNYLASLNSSGAPLTPDFYKKTQKYKVELPEGIDRTNITAAAELPLLAKVTNANKTYILKNDKTKNATVKVRSQAGQNLTYTVEIHRAASTNNSLAWLKTSSALAPLNRELDNTITDYTVSMPASLAKLTISTKMATNLAKVKTEVSYDGGTTYKKGNKVTLANGASAIVRITVTAQSNDQKIFTITVTRASKV